MQPGGTSPKAFVSVSYLQNTPFLLRMSRQCWPARMGEDDFEARAAYSKAQKQLEERMEERGAAGGGKEN